MALAAGIAYAVHKGLSRLLRRLLAGRYPAVLSMFTQTRSVSRMALLILAMIIAIPAAPIPYETAALLARVLSIAIIGLVGWAAIITLNIAADFYLRRFRIDTEDNLLARKHFTQIRVLLAHRRRSGGDHHRRRCADDVSARCANTATACSPPPALRVSLPVLRRARC